MEVQIGISESDSPIGNKVKLDHDKDVVKPTTEGNSSSGYGNNNEDEDDDDMIDFDDYDDYDDDDDDDDDYNDDDDDYNDGGGGGGDGQYYILESLTLSEEAQSLSMLAQFDNADLAPEVEPSLSWLYDLPPVTGTTDADLPADALDHKIPNTPLCKSNDIPSSSTSVYPNIISTSALEKEAATNEELNKKFENFKLFDIVDDISNHHFNNAGFQGQQPPSTWTKKIQDEWKILEKDLPDTIFVRAYETRMDLLRAVIVGPAGTPYHDGLFVFDIHFPPTYPDTPPMVYYCSGGLRLNPNLYASGKVCLSLLNTWTGEGTEKWMTNNSTMLQVLVSIQALVLNDKPFFNEPGYDNMFPGAVGEKKSKRYNEHIFILSLKTMIYTLRKPPKHFEDLVVGHFCSRANVILSACRAYMEGVQVGSAVDGGTPYEKTGSKQFKEIVGKMVNGLVANFSRYGAANCEQYRVET